MRRSPDRLSVENEKPIQGYFTRRGLPTDPLRALIPKLVDQYGLLDRPLGTREADHAWLEEMSTFIYKNDAAESMDNASRDLDEQDPGEAEQQQKEAEEKLEEALEEIEERLNQLRDETREEKLRRL